MSDAATRDESSAGGGSARLRRSVFNQGSLIFSGFAAAQALSFVRNAIIGHTLAKGDFGIAATITLTIQLVETLSDLGSDRLIVQDKQGATARFVAASHTLLLLRGMLVAFLLYVSAPFVAAYFLIPHATAAFQLAALAPLIKGFVHLDYRCAQRTMNNRPQVLVELLPQIIALAATVPLLNATRDFSAVAYLALVQAISMVVASHLLSQQPYRLAADKAYVLKQLRFGWPILASALPLVAVYHGDRIIIARQFDMEAIAAYSAALMLTMVPALLVSRVAHALMLPVFSDAVRRGDQLRQTFTAMSEGVVLLAACFAALFIMSGGIILTLAFGPGYRGYNELVAAFTVMWTLRMIQSAPGMALMAQGTTRPFAIAGLLRALALPVVALAAAAGHSLTVLASIGAAFELVSLGYITLRLEAAERGLAKAFARRAAFIMPAVLIGVSAQTLAPANNGETLLASFAMMMLVLIAGLATMPALRRAVTDLAHWPTRLWPSRSAST